MLQELYVAIGLVTFVYFLLKKKRQRQRDKPELGVVEITPLQPPSPMSVCDSDEDLLDVSPLQLKEDYID